jgi:SnoaL-like polyketide cyclase
MTTEERNKAGFRRVYEEGLNRGVLAIADELIAPDWIDHEAHPGGDRGPESMRQLITMLRTAFPDCTSRSKNWSPKATPSLAA